MDAMNLLESLFRWTHVVAGILWIGLLFFFNWVNSAFAPTMDADTKKKVVPELLPRTLYWFRWGAAYTWITGVVLLLLVFYHTGIVRENTEAGLTTGTWIFFALTFALVFAYDALAKGPMKPLPNAFWGGVIGTAIWVFVLGVIGGFSFRGVAIHLGTLFGSSMAFNVWFRIWPAQQKIITAIKNGEAPDADLTALAGLRSKHNTYMSIPLVFVMLNQHSTWAASPSLLWLPAVVAVGWLVCTQLYNKAKTVPGF